MTRRSKILLLFLTSVIATILAGGAIGIFVAIDQYNSRANFVDPAVSESDLQGTWISSDGGAEGSIVLEADGRAVLTRLTVYDQQSPFERTVLVEDLSAEGEWYKDGYSLYLQFPVASKEQSWTVLIESSIAGGIRLNAIVGDPDTPTVEQVFTRQE